jgi:cytoskeletal protein CcmA (bactofilin family)
VVFRRDNKVDSFQRQMSALRNQIGASGEQLDDLDDDMPELEDEGYDNRAYRSQSAPVDSDSAGYSFGNYPTPSGQASQPAYEEDAPAIPQMPSSDADASVIAADANWKGDITAERNVHVLGKIQGSITANEDIWIAEGAEVNATVTAMRVIVGGTLMGAANASSRFEVLPSGRVTADVTSPTTVVHEGASLNGNFRVGNGDDSRSNAAAVVQRRSRAAS